MDVTNREEVNNVMARVKEQFGRIDILVNNAATLDHTARLEEQNDDFWERDLRVNLTGSYNCCKAVWPYMKEQKWGRIINMASVAGTMGGFGQASYSTTKAGVLGLTRTLALEGEELLGKKPFYTIPSFLVSGLLSSPAFRSWVMVEKETIQYTHLKTQYDCSQAVKDLQASGVRCPELADYIKAAVRFYKQHRNDPDKVILVDRARKKDGSGRQIAGYRGHHWDDERAYPG